MRAEPTLRRALAVGALVLVPVLVHVAIVETSQVRLTPSLGAAFRLGVITVAAASHWAIYTGLLLTFGVTLRPGHDPLITALTRRLHGPIPPELERYTRRVTLAWCCFFAAQLTISVSLFAFAPIVVWSFFVNILDLPLVAAMFALEYLVRLRCLRDPPRHSLAAIAGMIADIRKPHSAPECSP